MFGITQQASRLLPRPHALGSSLVATLPNIGGVRWHDGRLNKKLRMVQKKHRKKDVVMKSRRACERRGEALKSLVAPLTIKQAFHPEVQKATRGWAENDPLLEIYPQAQVPEPLSWANRYEVTADPTWMAKSVGRAHDNLRLHWDETRFRWEKRQDRRMTARNANAMGASRQ